MGKPRATSQADSPEGEQCARDEQCAGEEEMGQLWDAEMLDPAPDHSTTASGAGTQGWAHLRQHRGPLCGSAQRRGTDTFPLLAP